MAGNTTLGDVETLGLVITPDPKGPVTVQMIVKRLGENKAYSAEAIISGMIGSQDLDQLLTILREQLRTLLDGGVELTQ